MEDHLRERPSDNFRTALTDPSHFFGRSELLRRIEHSPCKVRVILGGRRLGKTSALRAVEWNLLDHTSKNSHKAFPVFISLQAEQPKDPDNFRYLLIARLREAIERWRQVPGSNFREMYRSFLRQVGGGEVAINFLQQINVKLNIKNPDHERRLIHDDFRRALLKTIEELRKYHFEGVCFLLDGADFVVRQAWANDIWSYFRALKDTDTALIPFLGLILSGYRELKEYQQRINSPLLNIAEVEWLAVLTESEVEKLVLHRSKNEKVQISSKVVTAIQKWAGCHPYLTQQMINAIFDNYREKEFTHKYLINKLMSQHNHDFLVWWNKAQQADGCSDIDHLVYDELVKQRSETVEGLVRNTNLAPGEVQSALEVLAGTGIIRRLNDEQYTIGARLFERWVARQKA